MQDLDTSLPMRLKDEKGVVLIEIVNGEYRVEILDAEVTTEDKAEK